jgi:hypothetical protein
MAHSTAATDAARHAAKAKLREVLTDQLGDPQQEAVMAAIAQLVSLNPSLNLVDPMARLTGDWRLISAPSFPQGKRQADGTYVYTLGRLAFNMFQPQALRVVINQVTQPVLPIPDTPYHSHDIVVHFTTLTQEWAPLQGIVRNLGICEPSSDTTLQVQFTGGSLEPAADTDRQQWQTMFGKPTSAARLTDLKDWFQGLFLKLLFGLVPPQGMDDEGRLAFTMQRSPKVTLTVLYLDDELRITKGEKGTVLVCERI